VKEKLSNPHINTTPFSELPWNAGLIRKHRLTGFLGPHSL
jgi:hypothetical protein